MTNPAPKYQPTDDRRRAIAAAARSLIFEKGFEGLRTREIADRVGINIATLHYHVPTKEALIELVTQSMKADFIAQHMRRSREGLSPLAQLEMQIEEFRELRDENPELLQVMDELTRRSRHDENAARHIHPLRARWHQQFVDILVAGVADGTFRADLDPVGAASMVIGSLIVTSINFQAGEDSLDRVTAELFRAILSDEAKGKRHV